jgi:hypothetical protein
MNEQQKHFLKLLAFVLIIFPVAPSVMLWWVRITHAVGTGPLQVMIGFMMIFVISMVAIFSIKEW